MSRPAAAPDLGQRTARFPFPFLDDIYRYSTNIEPARQRRDTAAGWWGEHILDIDAGYHAELAERAAILAADPARCIVAEHMRPAAWDAMLSMMAELGNSHPGSMQLSGAGDHWRWRNDLLDIDQPFTVGEEASLPMPPLSYLGSQIQEDIVLLDQRDGDLWADAGLVTFAADWSLIFDLGMRFLEVHGPVPRIHETGVITRARDFLLRLRPEAPYRRTNWTMSVGGRLDTSTETYPVWGPERAGAAALSDEAFGAQVQLRVEVQHLLRLPTSAAVLFLIRTYLLPLNELARIPAWSARLASVLAELPPDMVDYKGLSSYRDRTVDWLRGCPGAGQPAVY